MNKSLGWVAPVMLAVGITGCGKGTQDVTQNVVGRVVAKCSGPLNSQCIQEGQTALSGYEVVEVGGVSGALAVNGKIKIYGDIFPGAKLLGKDIDFDGSNKGEIFLVSQGTLLGERNEGKIQFYNGSIELPGNFLEVTREGFSGNQNMPTGSNVAQDGSATVAVSGNARVTINGQTYGENSGNSGAIQSNGILKFNGIVFDSNQQIVSLGKNQFSLENLPRNMGSVTVSYEGGLLKLIYKNQSGILDTNTGLFTLSDISHENN